jgi:hypothetical protein
MNNEGTLGLLPGAEGVPLTRHRVSSSG